MIFYTLEDMSSITYEKGVEVKEDPVLGYLYFTDKDHPLASGSAYKVYYHRHVVSLKLGRWLLRNEVVHHLDGNPRNNDPDNLIILTHKGHASLHQRQLGHSSQSHPCLQCGKMTKRRMFCSNQCRGLSVRRVERPSKEQLLQEISDTSYCAVGRKYGVSDNAVRKWLKS